MKTKSLPSLYRYVIERLSTLAVSTFVPALNVLSTTLPESTFFSVVRTKAPPLPGLTCWKSVTVQVEDDAVLEVVGGSHQRTSSSLLVRVNKSGASSVTTRVSSIRTPPCPG